MWRNDVAFFYTRAQALCMHTSSRTEDATALVQVDFVVIKSSRVKSLLVVTFSLISQFQRSGTTHRDKSDPLHSSELVGRWICHRSRLRWNLRQWLNAWDLASASLGYQIHRETSRKNWLHLTGGSGKAEYSQVIINHIRLVQSRRQTRIRLLHKVEATFKAVGKEKKGSIGTKWWIASGSKRQFFSFPPAGVTVRMIPSSVRSEGSSDIPMTAPGSIGALTSREDLDIIWWVSPWGQLPTEMLHQLTTCHFLFLWLFKALSDLAEFFKAGPFKIAVSHERSYEWRTSLIANAPLSRQSTDTISSASQ